MPRAAKNPGVGRGVGGGRPKKSEELAKLQMQKGHLQSLSDCFRKSPTASSSGQASNANNVRSLSSSTGHVAPSPIGINQLLRPADTPSTAAIGSSSCHGTESTATGHSSTSVSNGVAAAVPPTAMASSVGPLHRQPSEREQLRQFAATLGLTLHEVKEDGNRLFHSLLHALNNQLNVSRAADFTAHTLRMAIVNMLDNEDLLKRAWCGTADQDATGGMASLYREIGLWASRNGLPDVDSYFAYMRGNVHRISTLVAPDPC